MESSGSLSGKRQPTILGVNLVYLSVLILMLLAQVLLAGWLPEASDSRGYYWKMAILELLFIGGPPLIYVLLKKQSIRRTFRFNSIKPVEVFLIVGMAVFGYAVIIALNLVWFWLASHWGTPQGQELPQIKKGLELLAATLAIGLVPALAEEFLFRGLILRGYERFGPKVAVIMTGILFGMLHLQLMSIPSIILIGIIISYVVYRTDSIIAGIIYHFIHNSIAVVFIFLQNFIMSNQGIVDASQNINDLPKDDLMAAFLVWGVIGFICLLIFTVCFITFHIYTKGKGRQREVSPQESKKSVVLGMVPAAIAIIVVIASVIFEVLVMTGTVDIL